VPDYVTGAIDMRHRSLVGLAIDRQATPVIGFQTRRVLGVQIVGEGATELIHIAQAVLNLKGTVDYFVQNTFNYPTLAEAYKIAGLDAFNRMPIPKEYKVKRDEGQTKQAKV